MLSNALTVQSSNKWPKTRKLIFMICLFSFLFQLYRITAKYYKYDTEFQTNLFSGTKEVLDLPAITLCVERDAIFLKSSLRKEFPDISQYLARIDNQSLSPSEKENRKDAVYFRYLERGLNINKYFGRSLKATDFTECYLDPPTIRMRKMHWNLFFNYCLDRSPALESLVSLFGRSGNGKCFTFFSRQQTQVKDVTDLQIDLKELGDQSSILDMIVPMDVFNDSLKISSFDTTYKSVFMFIHDSYGMPSFEPMDAIELKPGKRYEIRFWSTTKSLLKHPFRSDCYDYQKGLPLTKTKSKEQCIQDCYLDKSVVTLKCLLPQHLLLNNDKLRAYNPSLCHRMEDILISRKLMKQCKHDCRQECHRTEYKFDYKETDRFKGVALTPLSRRTETFSLVHLKYKKDSDSEYRERPIQPMCATIQLIFIALLIWFGLSIFSFSSVVETVANKTRPHMYYISTFEDKVSPSVVSVVQSDKQHSGMGCVDMEPQSIRTDLAMIRPKFTPTAIGSNVKLDHYSDFISKVVYGSPQHRPSEYHK